MGEPKRAVGAGEDADRPLDDERREGGAEAADEQLASIPTEADPALSTTTSQVPRSIWKMR